MPRPAHSVEPILTRLRLGRRVELAIDAHRICGGGAEGREQVLVYRIELFDAYLVMGDPAQVQRHV